MFMTIEFIFSIVTVVATGIFGVITGKSSIPNKYIPIQNFIVGIVAAIIAVYFGLFENIPTAILVSLGMAFGAGGTYDLAKTSLKK